MQITWQIAPYVSYSPSSPWNMFIFYFMGLVFYIYSIDLLYKTSCNNIWYLSFHLIIWYVSNVSSELNYTEAQDFKDTYFCFPMNIMHIFVYGDFKNKAFDMFFCDNKHYLHYSRR